MAKNSTYYYVIVFTAQGPKYVTKINYSDKTAEWNTDDKPLSMSRERANDMIIGLTWNGFCAGVICSQWEIESHPYYYKEYEISFTKKGEQA